MDMESISSQREQGYLGNTRVGSKGDKGQQSFKTFVSHVPDDRALALDGLAFDLRRWNIYV